MKKTLSAILAVLLAALLCACGNTAPASKSESSVSTITSSAASEGVSNPTDEEAHENGYPKIEELVWSFRNTVEYDEPVAVFDYTNNSDYTIVMLELYFKMKEGVTSKQLQLIDPFTDELIPNDKIPDMEPYVYDWIVSDPGETAEGADCYIDYNTYPTSTDQCDLMEFSSANIHFIGEDGKIHTVSYSAENCGYALSENTEEPYVWVDNDYTKMIPKPNTRIASADQFEEDCLGVKAYDMSHDDFLEYIDSCEQMGFQNKYPNEDLDYSYTGTNANGYEIDVRYIDNMHYIEITLQKEEQ